MPTSIAQTLKSANRHMLTHFAAPRLGTLRTFFKTESDGDLLGCYAWNQAVAAGLFPIIGDFEVALRNALHAALSGHYGQVASLNWMLPRQNPAHLTNPHASPTLPSLHRMPQSSREDLIRISTQIQANKPNGYVVTPDDMIGAINFGFWEQLLRGLEHSSQPAGLRAAILLRVFPHAPNLAGGNSAFLARVLRLLKRIRDVRNRVGHHDSLWTTPEFDLQGNVGFIPRRPRQTINSLQLFCSRLIEVAGWVDPEIPSHILQSDHWGSFHALLSREALATYRARSGRRGTYQALLEIQQNPIPSRGADTSRKPGAIYARIRSRSYHF